MVLHPFLKESSNFSDNPSVLKLSNDDARMLDEELELHELMKALKGMKKNLAPGLDGLTVPFYLSRILATCRKVCL